jgi:dephospho-CoA kinase
MTHILGLTGSIGMGKSTTAAMFRDAGIPVWDADAAVHEIYRKGGAAVPLFKERLPSAVVNDAVDRGALKDMLSADPSLIKKLEDIVHPLVAAHRQAFLKEMDTPLVVLDMPLLFEIGAEDQVSSVLVVSAPADVQKARVMSRGEMTEEIFQQILGRQLPDAEKRQRADHIIETLSLDDTRAAVQKLIAELTGAADA